MGNKNQNQKKKAQKKQELKPKRQPKASEQTEFQKDLKQYIELMQINQQFEEAIKQKQQKIADKRQLVKLGTDIIDNMRPLIKQEMIKIVVHEKPQVEPMSEGLANLSRTRINRRLSFFKQYMNFFDEYMIKMQQQEQEQEQNRMRMRQNEQPEIPQRRLRSRRN